MSGITISIDPVILQLGAFSLGWHGLATAGGIVLAALLTVRESGRRGLDTDKVGNVAVWAILGGLIGARLFHVVDKLDYYLSHPHQIVMVNQGGLAVWGGLVIGGLVALFVARRGGIPAPRLADATAIGVIAGQMVGRLGCLINGDAYGGPTDMPWGFVYTNPGALIPDALRGVPTHPYPVYEIIWNLAVLGLLLFLRRRPLPDGMLFLTYVVGYALGRFALTFVRQEDVVLWGLQQAQVVALPALILALVGAAYLAKASYSAAGGKKPPLVAEES